MNKPRYEQPATYAERKKLRDRNRAAAYKRKKAFYDDFVRRNNLSCYVCKSKTGPWAVARRNAVTGHKWAVCKSCAGTSDKRVAEGDTAGTSEP